MNLFTRIATALAAVAMFSASTPAQQARPLDAVEKKAAIDGVARQIEQHYVFPEVGKKMAAAIRERAARGEYERLADGVELADALTEHLRQVGHDLHVRVAYSPDQLPPEPERPAALSAQEIEQFRDGLARANFGFERLEVLPGNLGYIKLNLFAPPELAADTYAAAMAYVANTDALILDLRDNGGSLSPDAIPMLCTYFFERPVHLIDIKWNFEERPRQLWTWAYVPGRRYLNKPIYVLTSRRTFSGAEEFAYDLKNLKRATLIGEMTGGGANPGGTRRASDHFSVFVPFGRVTSPITRTNWEGVGVSPDIAVAANKALLTARLEALNRLEAQASDERWKGQLRGAAAAARAALASFQRVTFTLEGFEGAKEVAVAGSFNSWSLRSTPLARQGKRWEVEVELERGRYAYKFIVDGKWMIDPANSATERDGEHVNSVRVVG